MNKFEKKFAKFNKLLDEYNRLARKYGWLEICLKEHVNEDWFSYWGMHTFRIVGGCTSYQKPFILMMLQDIFIMRPRYRRLFRLTRDLDHEYGHLLYDQCADEFNEKEMNSQSIN